MEDAAAHQGDGAESEPERVDTSEDGSGPSRRWMLRAAGVTGVGLGASAVATGSASASGAPAAAADPSGAAAAKAPKRHGKTMAGVPFERHKKVRVGIIGVGNRGSSMLPLYLAMSDVKVTAICDVRADAAKKAAKKVTDAGQPSPALYTKGDHAYTKLCERDDVDFVYCATPWQWHFPIAIKAMKSGKHYGGECPAAMTLDELWELVDTSERTRRHCLQLENCCYGQNEMRVLRMAHEGLFGTLLHGAGAYLHDLREMMFDPDYYAGPWRRTWHTKRHADLYPTHSIGPISAYMDVNRGDRLVRITSMGSPSAGLAEYRKAHKPAGDPSYKEKYVEPDMMMSLVQTEQGRVIRLEHDVSNPHPYSRLNVLGGSKGVFEDYPPRIYLEPDQKDDEWGDFDTYKKYDHWLWKEHDDPPGGHGGMDYMLIYRLTQTLKLGLVPDMDVYDAATWSAPLPLSQASVTQHGTSQEFPDFTRGEWRASRPGIDSEKPS